MRIFSKNYFVIHAVSKTMQYGIAIIREQQTVGMYMS